MLTKCFTGQLVFSLLVLIIGALYSFMSFKVISTHAFSIDNLELLGNAHENFYSIFCNNLIVGALLAVGGYLSGGLLTVIILFWNGFLLTEIVQSAMLLDISGWDIAYSLMLHGPLEIFAFLLFAKIGLGGWQFYKGILREHTITFKNITLKGVLCPVALLVVAALIESNLT